MSKSEKRKKTAEKKARKKRPRRFFIAILVLLLIAVAGFFAYKHFTPDGEVAANALDGLSIEEGVSYPSDDTPTIIFDVQEGPPRCAELAAEAGARAWRFTNDRNTLVSTMGLRLANSCALYSDFDSTKPIHDEKLTHTFGCRNKETSISLGCLTATELADLAAAAAAEEAEVEEEGEEGEGEAEE